MAKLGSIVLGVVPCRLGSTRFPGKPLARLAGRPLVEHVLRRLNAASSVDGTLVATDSDEIAARVRELGGDVALVTEPCATGSDRTAAAVRDWTAEVFGGRVADVVVSLQVDQPLIDPSDVDKAVGLLDAGFDITTLAYPCSDEEGYLSRDVVKVVAAPDGRALYFSRAPVPSSKSVPVEAESAAALAGGNGLYLHHVGLYCFRRSALERFAAAPRGRLETTECLEQLRALEMGLSVGVAIADRGRQGVDRPEDLDALEELLSSGEVDLSL